QELFLTQCDLCSQSLEFCKAAVGQFRTKLVVYRIVGGHHGLRHPLTQRKKILYRINILREQAVGIRTKAVGKDSIGQQANAGSSCCTGCHDHLLGSGSSQCLTLPGHRDIAPAFMWKNGDLIRRCGKVHSLGTHMVQNSAYLGKLSTTNCEIYPAKEGDL